MCIRIIFPPTGEQITQAQWTLVDALEQSLGNGWCYADTSRALRQLIRQTHAQAHDPQAWAAAFAEALVDTLTALQSASDAASNDVREVGRLRLERDHRPPATTSATRLAGAGGAPQGRKPQYVAVWQNATRISGGSAPAPMTRLFYILISTLLPLFSSHYRLRL